MVVIVSISEKKMTIECQDYVYVKWVIKGLLNITPGYHFHFYIRKQALAPMSVDVIPPYVDATQP